MGRGWRERKVDDKLTKGPARDSHSVGEQRTTCWEVRSYWRLVWLVPVRRAGSRRELGKVGVAPGVGVVRGLTVCQEVTDRASWSWVWEVDREGGAGAGCPGASGSLEANPPSFGDLTYSVHE